jgi:hypothetical protein
VVVVVMVVAEKTEWKIKIVVSVVGRDLQQPEDEEDRMMMGGRNQGVVNSNEHDERIGEERQGIPRI